MGLVYRAFDPKLDRPVAIKVLRSVHGDVARHLRREAQALAELEHPNVVKVFDVGTFEGRMFLVMPLLEGERLDQWCRHAADDEARMAVLLQVARGLRAAHRQGVLHRDVKPANVIVDGHARAFVLDFGLSRGRAIRSSAVTQPTGASSSTRAGGTAGYVAPEQAEGPSAEATVDVFAFCMTAIECLTDQPPAPQTGPACTSTEIETMLARVPPRWRDVLRAGTLEDPHRRLASMDAVIEGLQGGARSSVLPWMLPLGVAIGVGALVGFGGPHTKDEVAPPQATSRAVDPTQAQQSLERAQAHLAREAYVDAESAFEDAFRRSLELGAVDVELSAAMGMAQLLLKQGRPLDARRWIRHADAARARGEVLEASNRLKVLRSQVARARGDLDSARTLADEAVAMLDAQSSAKTRVDASSNLGRLLLLQGDSKGSVEVLARSLADARAAGLGPGAVGALASDLGAAHLTHGDVAAATPLLEEAVAQLGAASTPQHSRRAMAAQNLAIVQWRGGDLPGAIASFTTGVEAFEAAFGPDHPEVAHALENLSTGLIYAQRYDDALTALHRALVIREARDGGEHPSIARTLGYMAQAHEGAGHWPQAEAFAERAHAMAMATVGRSHATTAETLAARARIAAALGKLDAAREFSEAVLEIYDVIGAGPLERASTFASLAYALCAPADPTCRRGSPRWDEAVQAAMRSDQLHAEAGDAGAASRAALHAWAGPLLASKRTP